MRYDRILSEIRPNSESHNIPAQLIHTGLNIVFVFFVLVNI